MYSIFYLEIIPSFKSELDELNPSLQMATPAANFPDRDYVLYSARKGICMVYFMPYIY